MFFITIILLNIYFSFVPIQSNYISKSIFLRKNYILKIAQFKFHINSIPRIANFCANSAAEINRTGPAVLNSGADVAAHQCRTWASSLPGIEAPNLGATSCRFRVSIPLWPRSPKNKTLAVPHTVRNVVQHFGHRLTVRMYFQFSLR